MSRHCVPNTLLTTASAVACGLIAAIGVAAAQTAPQPAPQPSAKAAAKKSTKPAESGEAAAKPDPAAAQRAIESGIASYSSGKFDLAVQQLTTGLSGGKLPAAQMARALYYRGAAYRKQSKPAQAIADLQSALWLKNGLNDTERTDALAQRAAAYREAGLPDQSTDGSPAKQAKATPAPAPSPAPAVAAAAPPKAVAPTPAPAPAVVAPAKPVVVAAAAPPAPVKPTESVAQAPRAVAPPQAESLSSGGGVGGFFSNLFGGASSAPAPAAPPAPPATQTSGWSNQVQVTPTASTPRTTAALPATAAPAQPTAAQHAASSAAQRPAAGPTASPVAATAAARATETASVAPERSADPYAAHSRTPPAKYQLQVAAVRTRNEAQAIAARIRQQHGKEPGIRDAVIDETTVGSMGIFYRVRLGPYAEASEPSTLCKKLRGAGVDCLLVTP